MVKASKNLTVRLRLLKEQLELIKTIKSYGRKPDKELLKDFNQSLTYCKRLYKKELLNTPIKDLL